MIYQDNTVSTVNLDPVSKPCPPDLLRCFHGGPTGPSSCVSLHVIPIALLAITEDAGSMLDVLSLTSGAAWGHLGSGRLVIQEGHVGEVKR